MIRIPSSELDEVHMNEDVVMDEWGRHTKLGKIRNDLVAPIE